MSQESAAVLERLLRSNGLSWIIDMHAPSGPMIPALLEQLDRVASEYRNRLRVNVPFSPEALEAEAGRNPHKVRAFLQAVGTSHSAEMLVMVWRILQGLRIHQVEMKYGELDNFSLVVILALPGEKPNETDSFRSQDINDAALVRHFGITTIDGRPVFDGFFPLRQK